MKENVLVDKSKCFAIKIVRLYKYLNEVHREHILSKQILRSGTSIGANAKEGAYAQTKADLIAKLFIAQKECAETEYWLELMQRASIIPEEALKKALHDCGSIRRMLVSSVTTLKN